MQTGLTKDPHLEIPFDQKNTVLFVIASFQMVKSTRYSIKQTVGFLVYRTKIASSNRITWVTCSVRSPSATSSQSFWEPIDFKVRPQSHSGEISAATIYRFAYIVKMKKNCKKQNKNAKSLGNCALKIDWKEKPQNRYLAYLKLYETRTVTILIHSEI